LNAFNATGAYLTNKIPGYQFTLEAMQQNNESDTCPIDHHAISRSRSSNASA
jgi:hypothetical protein